MRAQSKFAIVGALLALGSPAGMLLMRVGRSDRRRWGLARSYCRELRREPSLYGYLAGATAVAFAIFGHTLGRLADALEQQSTTDPVTGLGNARAFAARLQEALRHAARYREPLSILLVDIDDLKSINDTRGHAAGNAAIARVGGAFRKVLRAADIGFRWGGDEFAALAPHTGPLEATRIAERLIDAVTQDGGRPPLSVSIGIASLVPDPPDIARAAERIVQEADAALYRAKQDGRGCFRMLSAV